MNKLKQFFNSDIFALIVGFLISGIITLSVMLFLIFLIFGDLIIHSYKKKQIIIKPFNIASTTISFDE